MPQLRSEMTVDPEPSAASAARERWLVAVVAVLVACGVFWPLPLHLTDALVTIPTGEAPEHVWRWLVGEQVGWPWGGDFDGLNHPDGLSVHVIDPLNGLMARALGWWWGGPAAGHAVVQVMGVLVGGLAGHLLADEAGADCSGRILGAAAGLAIPTVVGAGIDGITEGLGLGWLGLQLAMMLRVVVRKGGRRFGGARAGAPLGRALHPRFRRSSTACWSWLRAVRACSSWPRRWRRCRRCRSSGRRSRCGWRPVARASCDGVPAGGDCVAVRREGADLLDLPVPAWVTGASADAPTTGHLGLFWLGLVGWGAVRAVRSGHLRVVGPWLGGSIAFAVLALGPLVVVAGEVATLGTAELWAPAAFLESVPVLGRLSRWYRAAAVAVLLSIPVAVHAVRGRSPGMALLLAALVVLDARTGSPAPFPVPLVSVDPVDGTAWSGAVAELPPVHPLGAPGVWPTATCSSRPSTGGRRLGPSRRARELPRSTLDSRGSSECCASAHLTAAL